MAGAPSQATGRLSPHRRWLFRLISALGIPLLVLSTVELGLRLGGYGHSTGFFLASERDGQPVLIENPRFGWRFFPPRLSRTPQPLALPARKPPGTCRIFVFGESAAMGDPEPDFGPSRMLQVLLEDQFPRTRFEVVNVAMTAINSHAVRAIARDCTAREGDVWVVYMGNNEVIGPFGAGTIFGAQTPSRAMIRLILAVKVTRLGQLLEALATGAVRGRGMPAAWGGLEMFLEQQVRADDARMARVRAHYQRNLEEVIRLGRNAGAKVLVCTVACNLKDCAPFGSQHRAGLSPEQLAAWDGFFQQGLVAEAAGRTAEAVTWYQKAAELDTSFAALQFRLGRGLLAQGQPAEARSAFVRARDEDTLRFRADSELNRIVRTVVTNRTSEGVYLVDAEAEFARRSPDGLPGLGLFWEHVHFNLAGTHALAELVARQVAVVLPDARVEGHTPRPWLTTEECARRLTYSRWNERRILSEVCRRHQLPPCTAQLDHAERHQHWQKKLAEQAAALEPAALQRAIGGVEEVLQAHPTDWVRHKNLAQLLEAAGEHSRALAEWQRVTELMPQYGNAWYHLGNLLDLQGRSAEAQRHFERALALSPFMAEAMNGLGLALAAQGRMDESFRQYAKAIATNPKSIHAYINWGLGLASQARYADAITQYERALQLDPANATTHNNLGEALAASGQSDAAVRHLSRAVELQPGFVLARINLGRALARQGKAEAALPHLEAALRQAPQAPEAHCQLGLALEQLNRWPEALAQFRETLRLAPDHPVARAAITRVQPRAQ
jgi:tetratricopeptide (TPR) repeat protein